MQFFSHHNYDGMVNTIKTYTQGSPERGRAKSFSKSSSYSSELNGASSPTHGYTGESWFLNVLRNIQHLCFENMSIFKIFLNAKNVFNTNHKIKRHKTIRE